jgi:hypothetical protein
MSRRGEQEIGRRGDQGMGFSPSPLLLLSPSPWLRAAFVAALLLVLGGCGGGKANVTGKVTHQGKTVLWGTVIMQGPDGIPMTGTIQPDGTYIVQGVASGKVLIGVVSRDPGVLAGSKSPRLVDKGERNGAGVSPAPVIARSQWFQLPQKYEDPLQSGLNAKIGSGSVNYDITLP